MKKILITGATGNVGKAIIQSLSTQSRTIEVLAGLRNIEKDKVSLENYNVQFVHFDFTDLESVRLTLAQTDVFFLLRPPQLADVPKYFQPVIDIAVEETVEHIVFLSVQGADKNTIIPHAKIEQIILDSGLNYTFLRPAYFMQNFTTTLKADLIQNRIFLPAGQAKFTVVDVEDIGKAGAIILNNPTAHLNQAYDLTNEEQLTFGEMAATLSKVLNRDIRFESPNLLRFFFQKRKEGTPTMFIFVMIMLHYLPRFQAVPPTSDILKKLLGKSPNSFQDFVKNNQSTLSENV